MTPCTKGGPGDRPASSDKRPPTCQGHRGGEGRSRIERRWPMPRRLPWPRFPVRDPVAPRTLAADTHGPTVSSARWESVYRSNAEMHY